MAYSHAFKHGWAIEIVRGAVSFGCSEIAITQTTNTTVFCLVGSKWWSGSALLRALADFDTHSEPAYRHLAIAISVLAKVEGNPFTILLGDHNLIDWDGSELSVNDESENGQKHKDGYNLILAISNFKSNERSFLSKLIKTEEKQFIIAINSVLQERAFCCPIPLTCDARPITGLEVHPYFTPSQYTHTLLQVLLEPDHRVPALSPPNVGHWTKNKRLVGDPKQDVGIAVLVSLFMRQHHRSTGVMSLNSKSERVTGWMPDKRPSLLVWVQDGVVVWEEVLRSGGFGFLILVSAEGLKTDASGYQLVQDENYYQRREAILHKVGHEVHDVLQVMGLGKTPSGSISSLSVFSNFVVDVVRWVTEKRPTVEPFKDLYRNFSGLQKLNQETKEAFEREYKNLLETLFGYRKTYTSQGPSPKDPDTYGSHHRRDTPIK